MNTRFIISLLLVGLISFVAAENVSRSTPWNVTDGGKIVYLDRHNAGCGYGEAMRSWRVQREHRDSDKIRINLQCIKSDAVQKSGTKHTSTAFNSTWWWSYKCLNYLDRHHINCSKYGNDWVLQQWRLGRNGSKINVNYTCVKADILCCKTVRTSKNDLGGKQLWYMDRHNVGDSSYKGDWAMSQWRMTTIGSKIQFHAAICKLRDSDAQRKANDLKAAYDQTNEDLRLAKEEKTNLDHEIAQNDVVYQNAKSNLAAAKKTVMELEDILKNSDKLVEDAQKALAAAEEANAKSTQEAKESGEFLKTHTEKTNSLQSSTAQENAVKQAIENLRIAKENQKKGQEELKAAVVNYNEQLNVISDLEVKVQVQEKIRLGYESTIEKDKQRVVDHQEEIMDRDNEIKETQEDITENKQEVEKAKAVIVTKQNTLNEDQAAVEALRKQLEEAENKVATGHNELKLAQEDQIDAETTLKHSIISLASLQRSKSDFEAKLDEANTKLREDQDTLEGIVGSIVNLEAQIQSALEVKQAKVDVIKTQQENLNILDLAVVDAESALAAAQDLQSIHVQKLENAKVLKSKLKDSLAEDLAELAEDVADVAAAKLALEQAQKYQRDSQDRYNKTKASFDIFEKEMEAMNEELLIKFRQQKGLRDNIASWSEKTKKDHADYNVAMNADGLRCV